MSKIIVKAHRDGFRRAGYAFNRAGIEINTAKLTKEQEAQIRNDPNLLVADVVEPAPSGKGKEPGGKDGNSTPPAATK